MALLTVRLVGTKDWARLFEMGRAFLAETPYRDRIVADEARIAAVVKLATEAGRGWVAEVDGHVVGFIGAIVYDHPTLGRKYGAEVVWWVDPAARPSGAGEQLFRAAEDWARQEGAVGMQFTAYRNPVLERLYRRWGYHAQEVVFEKEFTPCA